MWARPGSSNGFGTGRSYLAAWPHNQAALILASALFPCSLGEHPMCSPDETCLFVLLNYPEAGLPL